MRQKIVFTPMTKEVEVNEKTCFFPASTQVPEWFKKIPPERNTPEFAPVSRLMSTVKKCVPFIDALTTGYTVCLTQDVEFYKDSGGVQAAWWPYNRTDVLTIETDSNFRTNGLSVPKGASPTTWRFNTAFGITTPKGYSLLVTHPFNRFDLPFHTISAVIDTDTFHRGLIITVFMDESFTGILKKGTPLAQLLPFKRTDWKSEVKSALAKDEYRKLTFELVSVLNRAYSRIYWRKKSYE